jgi:CxxC motif-containing protein
MSTPAPDTEKTAQLVCIACPMACRLTVTQASTGDITVTGNRCPRGDAYGREEVLAPKRIVTAVVPTGSPDFPCAPVRTDAPVPKEDIPRLLRELYGRTCPLPVRQGKVLIEDFSGARVIVTRTLPPDDVSPVGET